MPPFRRFALHAVAVSLALAAGLGLARPAAAARLVVERHGGVLPDTYKELVASESSAGLARVVARVEASE